MRDSRLLVRLLADPEAAAEVRDWTSLLTLARAESLIGSLAWRLEKAALPEKVARILELARRDSDQARIQALWEAEMARRALAPLGVPIILLKGTAYAAAGLDAGIGRSIGDLDILAPRASLDAVQTALLAAGWEWVKEDEYDDQYYRRWMHELPPLIHKERDRMIDVHHTILPLTARPKPDSVAMIEDSLILPGTGRGTARSAVEGLALSPAQPLHHASHGSPPRSGEDCLRILSPPDMVVHSAAHLFADGDLAGGLRNLWDIDRLLRAFAAEDPGFWPSLHERAGRHGLLGAVHRAGRLAADLYGTPIPEGWRARDSADPLFKARLLARNGWGQATRPGLRLGFYVRSHWLRMPPMMLARHLWTKARKKRERAST
jgi:hypothetical protein